MRSNMIETLERRLFLHSAVVTNGVLIFSGEDVADILSVTLVGNAYRAHAGDGFSQDFPVAQVNAISVTGAGGDDQITIDAAITLRTTLFGGTGADTING